VKLKSNSKFEFSIENYFEIILHFLQNNPSCPLGINFDGVNVMILFSVRQRYFLRVFVYLRNCKIERANSAIK